ncbi:MAG: hypothetical protein WDA16_11715 [Candidatus Thermoplasmatota archaeon]
MLKKQAVEGSVMAKGYPAPENEDAGYPVLEDVLSEDTCIICKRRPREAQSGECGTCYAALHGPAA